MTLEKEPWKFDSNDASLSILQASVVPINWNKQKLIGWVYYQQLSIDFFHYQLFEILF